MKKIHPDMYALLVIALLLLTVSGQGRGDAFITTAYVGTGTDPAYTLLLPPDTNCNWWGGDNQVDVVACRCYELTGSNAQNFVASRTSTLTGGEMNGANSTMTARDHTCTANPAIHVYAYGSPRCVHAQTKVPGYRVISNLQCEPYSVAFPEFVELLGVGETALCPEIVGLYEVTETGGIFDCGDLNVAETNTLLTTLIEYQKELLYLFLALLGFVALALGINAGLKR